MNDTLDKLKEIWQQNEPSVDSLDDVNQRFSARLAQTKVPSLQQSLYKRTMRTGYIGFALPLISPLLYYVLHLPVWLAVVYGVFGLVAGTITVVLAEHIMRHDLMSLPVEEAIKKVASIKRKMLLHQIVDSGMAIIVLGLFLFQINILPDRVPLMIGYFAGLAAGLAYSVPKMVKNFRIVAQMMDYLKE